jgi:hypothetical protein
VKHGARGASRGGGGHGRGRTGWGGASTSREGPTGALCTGFTLVNGIAMGYPLVKDKLENCVR